MRNPLRKRLPRELRAEAGKYVVIFLLMVLSIAFISGYLVAAGSMIQAYNDGFRKYNIEDGHFETAKAMNRAQRKAVDALGITTYDLFYAERELTNDSTMRIYADRTEVNLVCLMEGRMPSGAGEIAIDRMYADNNGLAVGDTVADGSESWTVTGLVALPDYSCLFSDNSDSMFDAVKFGVGIVSADQFAQYDDLSHVYAWKYDDPPADEQEENDRAGDLLEALAAEVHLEDYVPRYLNQAIMFTGDDMVGDRVIMMVLLYAVIVIMAFVMGITVSNTIAKEANVIGTLRASGYTQGELVRHYMSMPLLVTVISAVIGNVLGYTALKDFCASMYYGSYSLPTYVTIWNSEAFVLTTIVPLVMMALINYLILRRRLSLSPLKFLRRDLSRNKHRRALRLPKSIPFFSRFRMRVIGQNISNYLILLVGILFANFLLLFGLLMPAILKDYQENIENNLLANYQYMLSVPLEATNSDRKLESAVFMLRFLSDVETQNPDAEKFSAFTLETTDDTYRIEDVLLYGAEPDSRYITADLTGSTVWVSSALADKDHLAVGDTFTLKELYGSETYEFTVGGVYDYVASLAVFMNRSVLNERMGEDADFFCGYLSDTRITDIDEDYVGGVVDIEALTKVSRQLDLSMGQLMYLMDGFAVIIFAVLMYLLSKIIIEKNAQSISMAKILGYSQKEIGRLYILPTTLVVLLFLVGSMPVVTRLLDIVWNYYITKEMSGWMPFMTDRILYIKMLALGVGAYAVVAFLEYRRIRRIPMDEALKNVE